MPRLIGPAAALLLGACAHMASPPGGPTDTTPPHLVAVYPDSVRVLQGFRGDAEFRFNEIISEGGSANFGYGTGDLEKLVLLSPDTLVPRVAWHRDRISIRPRDGWRPNTVYRIELLAGVRDLSNNPLKAPALITFATGGALPTRVLLGRAIDWTTRRAVSHALILATHLPDSLVYRTVSDSLGHFHLEALPDGPYVVRAVLDRNGDHRRNADEPWDTVRVAEGVATTGEIWLFPRDSAPARSRSADRADTTWAVITLSQPLAPDFLSGPQGIRVVHLPDSTSLGPVSAMSQALYDSLRPKPVKPVARPDSSTDSARAVTPPPKAVAPKPDSVAGDAPSEKRPVLNERLYVHTTGPFVAGEKYWIEVRGVRAAGGAIGTVASVLTMPAEKPTTKADSTKKPPVTKPDSSTAGRSGGGRGGGG